MVVYNDCAPNVVVCDPPPVTVFRSYCAPAVVYPTYAPRYYGGAYVARGYHPAYWGGFRAGFYYNSGRNYRAVYHGGHGRAYWR